MNSWRDWVLPGVVVVVLLTLLSTYFKIGQIESSLVSNTSRMLAAEFPWASVATDGRDITISGTSPSEEAKANALKAAESVYGVRIAKDSAELLEIVSPYLLKADKTEGRIALSGNVLNSGMRAQVIAAVKETNPGFEIVDGLTEARGEPAGFESFAKYAFGKLGLLDKGTIELSDTTLSIAGDASSLDGYDSLISGSPPENLTIEGLKIAPPRVSPYVWKAKREGDQIEMSGFAPDPASREALVAAIRSSLPQARVENRLRIASGAPENFKSATDYAMSFLGGFSSGEVALEDRKFSVSGVALDDASFARATSLINDLPEGYERVAGDILPMPARNFVWSVSKNADNNVTVEGIAVDQEAARAIVAMVIEATGATIVTDQQTFGSGEPDSFQKAREFAADLLTQLDSGNAVVEGNRISITGQVSDAERLGLLQRAMNLRVPAGYDGVLDVSMPDSVVIKGKEVKLDNVPKPQEPELTPVQVCENDMQAAVDGRKIQFESGKAILKDDSITVLDAVFEAMEKSCEKFPIEIGGHTDSDGDETFNQRLSEARSKSVAEYLLSKGLGTDRLSPVGFGETAPVADNDTPEGKAANRRIEFKVIR